MKHLNVIAAAFQKHPCCLSQRTTIVLHLCSQAIQRVMKGRTVVIVAHRLSTIQKADRILVISEGKIIEVYVCCCSPLCLM